MATAETTTIGGITFTWPISKLVTILCGVGIGVLSVALLVGWLAKKRRQERKRREALAGEWSAMCCCGVLWSAVRCCVVLHVHCCVLQRGRRRWRVGSGWEMVAVLCGDVLCCAV